MNPRLDIDMLCCPRCRAVCVIDDHSVVCSACRASYQSESGALHFRDMERLDSDRGHGEKEVHHRDDLVLRLKAFVKKHPKLFSFLYAVTTGPFLGVTSCEAIKHFPQSSTIINVGSGARRVRDDVINIDHEPYDVVDVVCDAMTLPFRDNTVDAIIAESILEHVPDPKAAVLEMHRVLKPGGLVYIVTPFMLGYHSSPYDYTRWTLFGLDELLDEFSHERSGIAYGPTRAVTGIVGEWLALILSLGSASLQEFWKTVFLFVFAPLNLLDYIFAKHSSASNIAYGIYYMGTKK